MQIHQKKQPVSPASPRAVPATQPQSGPSMDALRAGTAQPTADMLGHKVDLPGQMQAKMESAFGADLSGVQLYESQAVADAGAQAITQGNRIAFAPGQLDFASMQGQALLGHELSHVVSQARGEVSGGGFLSDHALEARADREGFLAAQGQSVSGGVVAPLSGASALSAAGPMQAKKDKNKEPEISSPTFATGTRDMSGTPVPQLHQIDMGAMKFDKGSYQKDADYQALQGLIRSYNYSNSAKDEIALMDAAMSYIQKNSTGDKAVHKGRTAKAEDILYQLSMKGGTQGRADRNVDALRQAATRGGKHVQDSHNTFDALQGVYQEGSGFSPALRMITAGVLADQNAGGAQAPEFDATTSTSGARVVFDPGAQGYQGGHHYAVNARTSGTLLNDAMGTTLHELTHVANGEVYQNTDNFISAEAGSTPQQLHDRREQRVQALLGIKQAESTAKTRLLADQKGGTQSLAEYDQARLEYAGGDKLLHYLAQKNDTLKARATRAYNEKKGTSGPLNYNGVAFAKMMTGSADAQEIADTKRPADMTPDFFDDATRADLSLRSKMMLQTDRVYNALTSSKNRETMQASTALNPENNLSASYGSNALIESDSVLNQMLLQYEHAGQEAGKKDTDSTYYRRLKAAALQAHVDRRRAKLNRG